MRIMILINIITMKLVIFDDNNSNNIINNND